MSIEECRKRLCLFYTLVLGIFVIIYIFILYSFGWSYFDKYWKRDVKWIGDISYVSQIKDDWDYAPFIEIRSENTGQCQSGWDPVVSKEWKGLESGCLTTGNVVIPTAGLTGQKGEPKCDQMINPVEPVIQSDLNFYVICGKRGGRPFKDALRPDAQNQCPLDTVPCSNATSAENTICVSQTFKDAGLCPITQIQLLKMSEAVTLDASIYDISAFQADYAVVTSKTVSDSLPIMSSKLSGAQPCYLDSESPGLGITWYPIEIDRFYAECTFANGFNVDTRYSKVGDFKISQFAIEEASGVYQTLENLPLSVLYVIRSQRESYLNSVFMRPTIPWKLECEQSSQKQNVISAVVSASNALDMERINGTRVSYALAFAFINIFIFIGTSIWTAVAQLDGVPGMVPLCVQFILFAVFGLGGIRLCVHTQGRLQTGIDSLKNLEQLINPCVDQLTRINDKAAAPFQEILDGVDVCILASWCLRGIDFELYEILRFKSFLLGKRV